MYKRVDRFHEHHHHWGGPHCVGLCMLGCVSTITLVGILFATIFQGCHIDGDCGSDFCNVGKCQNGRCIFQRKENCCVTHHDCQNIPCQTGLCDTSTHKCVLSQLPDNSLCDDNNKCTVQTRCQSGECVGNNACQNTQCKLAQCHPERGCVYQHVQNGLACDDGNPCTIGDMCYHGICTAGIPKECPDTDCTLGTCSDTGECYGTPRRDGELCDDGLECTTMDHCSAGTCTGTHVTCEDNNPCVINLCVEGVGCMEHQLADANSTCHSQCMSDSDCPGSYICHAGTCMNLVYNTPMYIRFIDYEIDKCDSDTSYRLVQHYILDVQKRQVNQDTRYKVALTKDDFIAETTQPLGFPIFLYDDNVQQSLNGNFSRTSFTVGTECQELTEDNCNIIFANRNYEFRVLMHDCVYEDGFKEENCIQTGEHIGASIHLSIIDCPFTQSQTAVLQPLSTLMVSNLDNHPLQVVDIDDIIRVHLTAQFQPWMTDIVMCVPYNGHHMFDCVTNGDTTCPHRGCRGWDSSPLKYQVQLMSNKALTAIARPNNLHTVTTCRDDELYDEDEYCDHECSYADDGFEIRMEGFDFPGDTVVIDVLYEHHLCGGRRLVEADNRQISYVKLR